jgi:hypothetical protein
MFVYEQEADCYAMDQSAEHVREISNTLYKYHLDNFLCDVFIVLPDGSELPAHSVVLSAVSALHCSSCSVAVCSVVRYLVH